MLKKTELISRPNGDKTDTSFSSLIFGIQKAIKEKNMVYDNLNKKRIEAAKLIIKNFEIKNRLKIGSDVDCLLTGLFIILDNASNDELDREIEYQKKLIK